jgi:hypothetical protein
MEANVKARVGWLSSASQSHMQEVGAEKVVMVRDNDVGPASRHWFGGQAQERASTVAFTSSNLCSTASGTELRSPRRRCISCDGAIVQTAPSHGNDRFRPGCGNGSPRLADEVGDSSKRGGQVGQLGWLDRLAVSSVRVPT